MGNADVVFQRRYKMYHEWDKIPHVASQYFLLRHDIRDNIVYNARMSTMFMFIYLDDTCCTIIENQLLASTKKK